MFSQAEKKGVKARLGMLAWTPPTWNVGICKRRELWRSVGWLEVEPAVAGGSTLSPPTDLQSSLRLPMAECAMTMAPIAPVMSRRHRVPLWTNHGVMPVEVAAAAVAAAACPGEAAAPGVDANAAWQPRSPSHKNGSALTHARRIASFFQRGPQFTPSSRARRSNTARARRAMWREKGPRDTMPTRQNVLSRQGWAAQVFGLRGGGRGRPGDPCRRQQPPAGSFAAGGAAVANAVAAGGSSRSTITHMGILVRFGQPSSAVAGLKNARARPARSGARAAGAAAARP